MASDPLRDYFTTTRVERLRNFRSRYRLWCGNWPPDVPPTAQPAWARRCYRFALSEIREDYKVWSDYPPKPSLTASVTFDARVNVRPSVRVTGWEIDDDDAPYPIEVEVTTVHEALLAGIGYVTAKSEVTTSQQLLQSWADRLGTILTGESDRVGQGSISPLAKGGERECVGGGAGSPT